MENPYVLRRRLRFSGGRPKTQKEQKKKSIGACHILIGRAQPKIENYGFSQWNQGLKKKWSQIYTFGRSASAILTIYNQIFFSRGPSALIFRDLSFLIWFNGICWRKSAFLHEKLQKNDEKIEKTDEKITLRFKSQFSISKRENTPETIPDPNPITKKTSVGRKK